MVGKAKDFLQNTDRYRIFFVLIGLLITGLTANMAFSLNRLVNELDLNTIARQQNVVVDARQTEKINSSIKNIGILQCEVKDIGKRMVRLEGNIYQ